MARTADRGGTARRIPPREHIVGPVPVLARCAGAVAGVAAVSLAVARFLPYVTVGPVTVTAPHGVLDLLAAALWPAAVLAAGASLVRSWLPRLGLAAVGGAGALAVGLALRTAYELRPASSHRAFELFYSYRLATTSVSAGPGVWWTLAGDGLLVAALVLAVLAWPRTSMDDDGGFEGHRPLVTGLAAVGGLLGALAVAARPQDVPDLVVQNASGLRITVQQGGEVSLLDRLGLDLVGTSLLALGILALALTAAVLCPRLATVGAFGVLSAYLLSSSTELLVGAARSADVVVGPGALAQLITGGYFAALTVWCWRVPGRAPTPPAQVALLGDG